VGKRHNLLLIHQFALPSVSGVTVMVSELLRLIPRVNTETGVECQSYQGLRGPDDLVAALYAKHGNADCVVGINLHIEVGWDVTLELLRLVQTQRQAILPTRSRLLAAPPRAGGLAHRAVWSPAAGYHPTYRAGARGRWVSCGAPTSWGVVWGGPG
jgi:hypothetical protein